jgi:hypothetical protein
MSDQVAVMNHGRFEQMGRAAGPVLPPATAFVAGFVGHNNRFEGRVEDRRRAGGAAHRRRPAPVGAARGRARRGAGGEPVHAARGHRDRRASATSCPPACRPGAPRCAACCSTAATPPCRWSKTQPDAAAIALPLTGRLADLRRARRCTSPTGPPGLVLCGLTPWARPCRAAGCWPCCWPRRCCGCWVWWSAARGAADAVAAGAHRAGRVRFQRRPVPHLCGRAAVLEHLRAHGGAVGAGHGADPADRVPGGLVHCQGGARPAEDAAAGAVPAAVLGQRDGAHPGLADPAARNRRGVSLLQGWGWPSSRWSCCTATPPCWWAWCMRRCCSW